MPQGIDGATMKLQRECALYPEIMHFGSSIVGGCKVIPETENKDGVRTNKVEERPISNLSNAWTCTAVISPNGVKANDPTLNWCIQTGSVCASLPKWNIASQDREKV